MGTRVYERCVPLRKAQLAVQFTGKGGRGLYFIKYAPSSVLIMGIMAPYPPSPYPPNGPMN